MAASRQIKKRARLTAQVGAACGGGLCKRVVFADAQGEGIAFGDEFYMPLTRPPSTAIAVPLPHRWVRQVRYGIAFPPNRHSERSEESR